ncbi:MAG: NfeD family protein [Nitriliruptorales bacterium]|nr:NfeD family protein [Nitriliruptorales bacterium]
MSVLPPFLRRAVVLALAVATALMVAAGAALAQADDADGDDAGPTRDVDILPLEGFIDPPVAGAIEDLIADANARGSELVVLQLDSSGGVSVDIASLAAVVRGSEVPVVVFVGPFGTDAEVRGAAAVLALAADALAVAPDATVGPVLPIDYAAPDTEPAANVPPELLDGAADVEGLRELGLDVIDANGLEPLLTELDRAELDGRTVTTLADDVRPRLHSLGLLRRMLHAAATPEFVYLLLVVGLGMLLFEVFQPGFGVAGLAGLILGAVGAFGLTVLPVAWWAVALVVLGLVLYAVDTAMAGFGAVTAAATASFAAGSWWFYEHPSLALSGWLVAATTVVAFSFFVVVMTSILRAQAGPAADAVEELVGRPGVVRSVLDPEGHVFVDGALWRARWGAGDEKVTVGTPIRVTGIDGPLVLVGPHRAADGPGDEGDRDEGASSGRNDQRPQQAPGG